MIVYLWARMRERRGLWALVAACLLAADLLVGPALIAWEIHLLREALRR